jgi:DNA-binding CsgD family transcriptional regulator
MTHVPRAADRGLQAPPQGELLSFLLRNGREHVVILDQRGTIVFRNEKAARFLGRQALPEQILSLAERILGAIAAGEVAARFPGQICLHREIGDRHWVFRLAFRDGADPLVGVYFCDETVSGKFDLNALRRRYGLTRRESDVLRHLLDGLKNVEIAEELTITEQTVKDYLSSIYGKFAVPDRFALLRCLIAASREDYLPE